MKGLTEYMAKTERAEYMDITQKIAASLLTVNHCNRRLRRSKVASMIRDAKLGRWLSTGETIKISKEGFLLDGQHRMTFVVETGITVRMLVVFGVDKEAQVVINSGTPNRLADVLHMSGEKNATLLAATLSWIWRKENDMPISHQKNCERLDAQEVLKAHPNVRASVERCMGLRKIIAPSAARSAITSSRSAIRRWPRRSSRRWRRAPDCRRATHGSLCVKS